LKRKVLFLVNHDVVIYNFRRELIEKLLDEDYQVCISCPYGKRIDYLVSMGCKHIDINIDRHGLNPFAEMKLYKQYLELLDQVKPDFVLTYTIKPNIYGNLACKRRNIPTLSTITGLGKSIERKGLTRSVLFKLYQHALAHSACVFFQNESNRKTLTTKRSNFKSQKVVSGSGVNLNHYKCEVYPQESNSVNILYIGRIMKEKGIDELIMAASEIVKVRKDVRFVALGFIEKEYEQRASELKKQGVIDFIESEEDVRPFIQACHAVVLPSYHEGMANVLLEASAMGRPVIASKIPGCIETFDEGITGLGFMPRDHVSLKDAINSFLNLPHQSKEIMGQKAREKMENDFNRETVVQEYMTEINKIYEEISK